jgi:N-formylglutamate amidohydrolase
MSKTTASGNATSQPVYPAPFTVRQPERALSPCIFTSPHSGANYPADFVAHSRLDPVALRGSEDAFMDELFAAAPDHGSPLLSANYPRAFVDMNREPWELDPAMFKGELPNFVNTASQRVTGGLGTIARVVSNGSEIYKDKLAFAEAERRVREIYMPYHNALKELIAATQAARNCAVIIDCHSMPSIGGPMDKDKGRQRADIILGDRFGASCSPLVTDTAEEIFLELGYTITRNLPYAGGYTTRNYGRPIGGIHTMQIEMNRALYMNEQNVTRGPDFEKIRDHMQLVVARLSELDPEPLEPLR